MTRSAFLRILFVAGIGTALLGLYLGSNTSPDWRWDSIVSIVVIAAGAYMTIVALVYLMGMRTAPDSDDRMMLPQASMSLVYGGFVLAISLVSALVVGHYAGRNEAFITFIFAFIIANLLFGLPLALTRTGSAR